MRFLEESLDFIERDEGPVSLALLFVLFSRINGVERKKKNKSYKTRRENGI